MQHIGDAFVFIGAAKLIAGSGALFQKISEILTAEFWLANDGLIFSEHLSGHCLDQSTDGLVIPHYRISISESDLAPEAVG